jgi:tyrosine-protein kinase Etk/Wzc
MAETGQRVVAVNTDFRKPQLGRRLGGSTQPLGFSLDEVQTVEVTSLLRPTGFRGVALLDLDRTGTPDELARATASVMPRLTIEADNVVIDTSPMAVTSEVLELVPVADLIVVVVRLDRTDVADLERTLGTLRELSSVPMVLVVVGERYAFNYYRRRGYGYRYGRRYGYGYGYGYGSRSRRTTATAKVTGPQVVLDDQRAELE